MVIKMNKKESKNINKINWSNVSVDPINNLYKLSISNIDKAIDNYFYSYIEDNKQIYDANLDLKSQVDDLTNQLENYKRSKKIRSKKVLKGFLIFLMILIIGLLFLPYYKKLNKELTDFSLYQNKTLNEIDILNHKAQLKSRQFILGLNLQDMLTSILTDMGISFKNDTYKYVNEQFYYSNKEFVDFKTYFSFKFKNTPVLNVVAKYLRFRNITTSASLSFPYTETVVVYVNGQNETKKETRYETLTGFHNEKTPFIDEENDLIILTNFRPDIKFWTNSNKYISFENKEFSKQLKVSNHENKINEELLQFFTIKAQEDYLKFIDTIKTNNLFFEKYSNFFRIKMDNKLENSFYNNKFNFDNDVNHLQNLNMSLNSIKTRLNRYLNQLITATTVPFISPVVNREWFELNKPYKIGNHDFSLEQKDNEIDYNYLISKYARPESLYFVNNRADKTPFVSNVSVKKNKQFVDIMFTLNTFKSKKMIDNVTVVGIHVGPKVIPVPYVRYFERYEVKQIFYLKKTTKYQIPNMIISKKTNLSYFDFDNPNKNENLAKLLICNPIKFLTYNVDANKDNLLKDIIARIQKTIDLDFVVEVDQEGFAIIANSDIENDLNLDMDKYDEITKKLKNIVLELNDL